MLPAGTSTETRSNLARAFNGVEDDGCAPIAGAEVTLFETAAAPFEGAAIPWSLVVWLDDEHAATAPHAINVAAHHELGRRWVPGVRLNTDVRKFILLSLGPSWTMTKT